MNFETYSEFQCKLRDYYRVLNAGLENEIVLITGEMKLGRNSAVLHIS